VPAVRSFSVAVDVPLAGDVDLAQILASIPRGTTLKGMFCARYVKAIDEPWDEIAEDLEAPPKEGKYTAFEDYPMVDYLRLLDRAARNRFPRASTREAYRLLGRGDVEVFADSTLGKVTFSLVRDPAAALARYPEILGVLTRGAISGSAKRGKTNVTLSFPRFVGSIESTLGMFEGLVQSFDAKPRSDVTIDDGGGASFVINWSD
jgi:uncharacterized protein (TIGR02265 family)